MILIFDFDGTIHKSHIIYEKAFYKILEDKHIQKPKLDPKSYLGDPPQRIWDQFIDKSYDKEELIKQTGQLMIDLMPQYGCLYDNAEKVLKTLKKQYRMYICSSCTNKYMNVAKKIYKLNQYFDKYLVGETYKYKEKFQILKENIGEDFIMIGDRQSDVMAAYKNEKISIFAKYGYGKNGEDEHSTYKIEKIDDLLSIKALSI